MCAHSRNPSPRPRLLTRFAGLSFVRIDQIMKKNLPTQKILNECFSYDQKSGEVFWKVRPINHFTNAHGWRIFNGKFAGTRLPESRYSHGEKVAIAVCLSMNGKRIALPLHHIVWALHFGKYPKDLLLHRDGDLWNNKVPNLVETTAAGRKATHPKNGGPTQGVSYHPEAKKKKYQAQITSRGRLKSLGYYPTQKEANQAYMEAFDKLYGKVRREMCRRIEVPE